MNPIANTFNTHSVIKIPENTTSMKWNILINYTVALSEDP